MTEADKIMCNFLWQYPQANGATLKATVDRIAKQLIDTVEFNKKEVRIEWGTTVADKFINKLMGWNKDDS